MNRSIRLLLLTIGGACLAVPQPAEALLEPAWDCVIAAHRDIVNSSTSTWIGVVATYVQGLATHGPVKTTCWLRNGEAYDPLTLLVGSNVTCDTLPTDPNKAGCLAHSAPASFASQAGKAIHLCGHVQWGDTITGATYTRRSSPCVQIRAACQDIEPPTSNDDYFLVMSLQHGCWSFIRGELALDDVLPVIVPGAASVVTLHSARDYGYWVAGPVTVSVARLRSLAKAQHSGR